MIKISYPKNEISSLVIKENNSEIKNSKLFPVEENQVLKLIENGSVDLALLTVDQYAKIASETDFRAIPHSCVNLSGMSGSLALFADNFTELKSFKNNTSIEFLSIVLKLVYKERYKIDLKESDKPDIELKISNELGIFDLAEDWFDTFKLGLPVYIWCAKYEDGELGLEKINEALSEITDLSEEYINKDGREGLIQKKWSSEIEKNIDELLELMFYQGLADEIYSVKIYD